MTPELEQGVTAAGAALGAFNGVTVPLRFGGREREWRAVRESSGVIVPAHRASIVARGDDRISFLQGMLSNDVKALPVGAGLHAAFLTQTGKVVSDLRVFVDETVVLLDLLAWRAAPFKEALERFIVADDVELETSATMTPLIGVEGPQAAQVIGRLVGEPPPRAERLALHRAHFQGDPLFVLSASENDHTGYLLCGSAALAAPLFAAACAAGAVPVGLEALNVLRVEAGIPWSGIDMDEDVLLMETGLERAVSFTKGCYLGQEVVERIAARGHVNRKLCGLLVEGGTVPPRGSLVSDGEREVGHITSGVRSVALDRVIALGYVHRNRLEPGNRLKIQAGDELVAATVTTLPFVA